MLTVGDLDRNLIMFVAFVTDAGNNRKPKSRADLDMELDRYMADTKPEY